MSESQPLTELDVKRPRQPWLLPTLVAAGIVIAILASVVIWLAVSLASPKSANLAACNDYAKTYNRVADAVRNKYDGATIRLLAEGTTADFSAAAKDAHGDVATAMNVSVLASLNDWGVDDPAGSMFLSADNVAALCKADGAPITLNGLK
jgi:hypothetical protein